MSQARSLYEQHCYLLQLNMYTYMLVYCDIKWKLHLHKQQYSGVALILSTVHTQKHMHTHAVLPKGDCEEDAVRVKWSSEAARQKNEWSDWHRSSRQGLPGLFLKCWCLELRHTLCSSSGVSVGNTLESEAAYNWQVKEYWDAPKQTQSIATLNLCGTHLSVSVSSITVSLKSRKKVK